MSERRAIKSAIWDDSWFGRLSPFEMTIWVGLFSKCADDQGRLQDDPALIRSRLFPYQDIPLIDIEQALNSFDGHIIRYNKGEKLIQIIRWHENQPMQYATPSNFPPPDGWIDSYRTNYKSKYIVFNWNGLEDTEIGRLLWNELSGLARVSSWTSMLGTLNPILNPILNHINKEDKKEISVFSHVNMCPECGNTSFINEEGCSKCYEGGYSVC